MSDAIRRIMIKAYANVLRNPSEAKTVWRLQQTFLKSEKRRSAIKAEEGVDVPPFLICSIATLFVIGGILFVYYRRRSTGTKETQKA